MPKSREHLFIIPEPTVGMTKSGILLADHLELPQTMGTILELPSDRSYLKRFYSEEIEIGDYVLYARYATVFLISDYSWEEIEVVDYTQTYTSDTVSSKIRIETQYVKSDIHIINVDDIEGIFKEGELPNIDRFKVGQSKALPQLYQPH